jgi:hypothetical protein
LLPGIHVIDFGAVTSAIACGIISAKYLLAGIGGSIKRKNTLLLSGSVDKSPTVFPNFLAKPSAAFVGFPSLYAIAAGGPYSFLLLPSVSCHKSGIYTTKRMGVANPVANVLSAKRKQAFPSSLDNCLSISSMSSIYPAGISSL